MANELGDIIIWDNDMFGHVGMIYAGGSLTATKIIHANSSNGFHVDDNVTSKKSGSSTSYSYLLDGRYNIYRPPWKTQEQKETKQRELKEVADKIAEYSTYGFYRAIRLAMGSSAFGSGARKRLAKYQKRRDHNFVWRDMLGDWAAFVTTITCAEAVMLCYQMVFDEADKPFFIMLDAAHTMPRTLRKWLAKNWEKVH